MFRTALVNAPRSSASGQLLRPTRSLGALRSSAAAAAQSAAAPPVPSRNLVSTVLLTRESYDAKNVSQLKAECKQRGLTTNGKRADIVARLLNDDAKADGSGLRTEAAAPSSQARGNASLASLRGGKQQPQKQAQGSSALKGTSKNPAPAPAQPSPVTEASPAAKPEQQGKASIPHPTTIKPGQVQGPGLQTSSTESGLSSPDSKLSPDSNPPGVPPQNEPSVPQTFKVDIPFEQVAPQKGPEIPIVTAYTSNRTQTTDSTPLKTGPKVVASTESDVIHALDLSSSTDVSHASEALSSASRSIKTDLGLAGDLTAQAGRLLNATSNLRAKTSEVTSALLSDATAAISSSTSGGAALDRESSSTGGSKGSGRRPLNGDERRGLYVLGGLVFGGFTLGGLGKPKKAAHDQH